MSEEPDVTRSTGIGGMGVSDDGQQTLIQFDTAEGPVNVLFPAAGLYGLGALAFQMAEDVRRKTGASDVQTFEVASWETTRATDGHVLVSLVLPTEARLTFRLPPNAAVELLQAMSDQAAAANPPAGGARR